MTESWRGLITNSVGHLISFSLPTHTHIFGNHSNGYGHLKTADVQSFVDCRKLLLRRLETWKWFSELGEDYDF
jgi:hypothetical protein